MSTPAHPLDFQQRFIHEGGRITTLSTNVDRHHGFNGIMYKASIHGLHSFASSADSAIVDVRHKLVAAQRATEAKFLASIT